MRRGGICILLSVIALMLSFGCGGDGGSDSGAGGSSPGTGTVSMDIADAKPFIAGEQPDELWLIFEEVQIHKSGGGWVSMDLPYTPLEINLLTFSDGKTTQLVTPTADSGHCGAHHSNPLCHKQSIHGLLWEPSRNSRD